MGDWYERAMEALTEQVNNCEITDAEFHAAMRDLNDELRSQADEAAEEARGAVLDRW